MPSNSLLNSRSLDALEVKKLKANLPPGPEGPEGPPGPPGPAGPSVKLINIFGAYDTTIQNPSTGGVPIKAKFGNAQSTTYIDLDSNGVLTFKENGSYLIHGKGQYGRTSSGGVVLLHFRVMVDSNDGTGAKQVGDSISTELNTSKIIIPIEISFVLNVTNAPYQLYFEVLRDNDSVFKNDGGLFSLLPNVASGQPTWNYSGSASINIERMML